MNETKTCNKKKYNKKYYEANKKHLKEQALKRYYELHPPESLKQKAKPVKIKCDNCGVEFNRNPSDVARASEHSFCNQKCYRLYKPERKPCPQCGKPILRKCRSCEYKKWLSKNPEIRQKINKLYHQNYKEKNKNWKEQMMEHIGQTSCVCGESTTEILCFHHRNPKEKSFGLAWAYVHYYSIETMKKETEKCDVMCANCHLIIHATHTQKHKKWGNWYRKQKLLNSIGKKCCEKCGNNDIRTLSFHHKHDKLFEISSYYNYSLDISLKNVIKETKKCNLLCENCHKKEH